MRFKANGNSITDIAFSPDGTLLATASTDSTLSGADRALVPPEPARMWNTTSGAQVGTDLPLTPEDLPPDTTATASLEFSADGETLTTAGPRTLRRWSVPIGELLSSGPPPPIPGQEEPRVILGFATLPGEDVALEFNGRLVALEGARLEPASAIVEPQTGFTGAGAIAASADGSLVAVGGPTGIFLWSPSGQQLLARAIPKRCRRLASTTFSRLDRESAPGRRRPRAELSVQSPVVWDTREANPQPVQFAERNYFPDISDLDGQGQARAIWVTFFKPPEPPHTEVWDRQTLTDTGARLEVAAAIVAVHPERGWLIGADFTHMYVFDIDTGEVIEQREWVVNLGVEAYFNADATRLITFVPEQLRTTLWDTETWQVVMDFREADGNGVVGAIFAPSGELLIIDPTGTIVVRDPETLEPIGSPMIGHAGGVILRFSSDGTRLLATGEQSILWDTATRTRIADGFPWMWIWPGPDSSDRGVSTDGETILIWNLNTDEWYDIACRAAGRNMTRAEWEEIGPSGAEYQATCPQFPLEP